MILEESLVGSPLVQIVWQRLQPLVIVTGVLQHIALPFRIMLGGDVTVQ